MYRYTARSSVVQCQSCEVKQTLTVYLACKKQQQYLHICTQAMFQEAPFKDWMIGSDKVREFTDTVLHATD